MGCARHEKFNQTVVNLLNKTVDLTTASAVGSAGLTFKKFKALKVPEQLSLRVVDVAARSLRSRMHVYRVSSQTRAQFFQRNRCRTFRKNCLYWLKELTQDQDHEERPTWC